jgi:NAD(P)-dependent dehydrogenase (short-subunit alcohol dehydrogenase family)
MNGRVYRTQPGSCAPGAVGRDRTKKGSHPGVITLKQQRVLVVGGSSGIGFESAASAVSAGASVTIASRSEPRLKAAAAKLGANVETAVLDTNDNAAIERFFAQGEPWDHIVISASQTRSGPVRGLDLADAKAAMESKSWGAYRIARAARFKEKGSLTLISGFLRERPAASSVLQGAINAALEALARGLALEFTPVRVNVVSPGLIKDTSLGCFTGREAQGNVRRRGCTAASWQDRPAGGHCQRSAVPADDTVRHRFHGTR